MLEVESRLGIDVHDGDGAAIVKGSQMTTRYKNAKQYERAKSRKKKICKRQKGLRPLLDLHMRYLTLRASHPSLLDSWGLRRLACMQALDAKVSTSMPFLLQFLGITAEKDRVQCHIYT